MDKEQGGGKMGLIYNDGMPHYELPELTKQEKAMPASRFYTCLLYTSDAADE